MAEPIGALGTAVGVVSLGIQVYQECKQYLGTVRSREEELGKTSAHLERLRESLDVISAAIPAFENEHRSPSTIVTSNLQSCMAELQFLQAELQKHELTPQTDLKGKLKEVRKILRYPFHRPDLDRLESRLERIIDVLSVAIDGLGLYVTPFMNGEVSFGSQMLNIEENKVNVVTRHTLAGINVKVTELDNTAKSSATVLVTLNTKSDTLHSAQMTTNAQLGDVQSSLSSVPQSVRDITSQVSKVESNILDAFQEAQIQMVAEIQRMMQTSVQQTALLNDSARERNMTAMMMSKPSLLRDAQNIASSDYSNYLPTSSSGLLERNQNMTWTSSHRSRVKSCGCWHRRQATESEFRVLSISLLNETIVDMPHAADCPLAQITQVDHQRKIGFMYTGLRRVLSAAISASLHLSYGAGGYSISPTFQYFAMVDSRQSPAFRLASVATAFFSHDPKVDLRNDVITRHFTSKLRRIYVAGNASLTDVNEYGQTLMDVILTDVFAMCVRHTTIAKLQALKDILMIIGELGVGYGHNISARFSQNISYNKRPKRNVWAPDLLPNSILPLEVPLSLLEFQRRRTYVVEHILPLLVQETPSQPNCLLVSNPRMIRFHVYGKSIARSTALTEAFGLDSPLFIALLEQNETSLHNVLCNSAEINPLMLRDNGEMLIRIAVCWPAGLRLLIEHMPILARAANVNGQTPISIALKHSRDICLDPTNFMCDDCCCDESLRILLGAGSYLDEGNVFHIKFCHSVSSWKALVTLLQHIKWWREKLRSFSCAYLSIDEKHKLGLCDSSVLDAKCAGLICRLEQKGIFPFRLFGLEPGDYRLGPPSSPTRSSTIYHLIFNDIFAELAFNMGFRDIDLYYGGCTPLLKSSSSAYFTYSFEYAQWLINHGASVSNIVPYDDYHGDYAKYLSPTCWRKLPQRRVWHILFRVVTRYALPRDLYDPRLLSLCLNSERDATDGCCCGCLTPSKGCTPLVVYLNGVYTRHPYGSLLPNEFICSQIVPLVGSSQEVAKTVIRVLTFHELQIRHTCCMTLSFRPSVTEAETYGEDFPNLREEDEHSLEQLEELMVEFMDQFLQDGDSLAEFIEGPWTEKMRQIRDAENEPLTQDQRDTIESSGVKLIGYDDSDTDEDGMVEDDSDEDEATQARRRDTEEFWIEEMDRAVVAWRQTYAQTYLGPVLARH